MANVAIKTYGCKVNQYESQLLRENLEKSGYLVTDYDDSDIVLVNSCCVTARAESEGRRFVRKSVREGRKVWVTGCGAKKENDYAGIEGVEVFPDKEAFAESKLAGIRMISGFPGRTRAFIKIEDGCENFCSYCIIPYVRGPVVSRDEREILLEAKALAASGYREIVMTGVDLGAYGRDTGKSLVSLLGAVSGIDGLERIRLSSMEVFHLDEKLVEHISGNRKVCTHFHIPLQSGSDRVLSLMKRRYTLAGYMEKLEYVRRMIPDVTFTTDLMVAFPGEGEDDFKMSCKAVGDAGFLRVHIFRYSGRAGTPACLLDDKVAVKTGKERESVLKSVSEETGNRIKAGFVGREVEILAESREGNRFEGYTRNYVPSFFLSVEGDINGIFRARGEGLADGRLFCIGAKEYAGHKGIKDA
jgi:threonylcarbamoyladenosine tRNA methylthiotransferase MtaB